MEVTLRGDEQELLGFLDRAALVIRGATAPSNQPIPPEVALLDRLLRQRSRAISRADVARHGAWLDAARRRLGVG
jgi:hypothetical protein